LNLRLVNKATNWYILIPEAAHPPMMKQGKVVIDLAITKDGSLQGMHLAGSAGHMALDRAAWGSITNSSNSPLLNRKTP